MPAFSLYDHNIVFSLERVCVEYVPFTLLVQNDGILWDRPRSLCSFKPWSPAPERQENEIPITQMIERQING